MPDRISKDEAVARYLADPALVDVIGKAAGTDADRVKRWVREAGHDTIDRRRVRVSAEDRAAAVACVRGGASLRDTAAVYGVSHQTIADWVKAADDG